MTQLGIMQSLNLLMQLYLYHVLESVLLVSIVLLFDYLYKSFRNPVKQLRQLAVTVINDINYFCKAIHHKWSTGSQICLCINITCICFLVIFSEDSPRSSSPFVVFKLSELGERRQIIGLNVHKNLELFLLLITLLNAYTL